MATLTVQGPPTRAGIDLAATAVAAAGGGDKFLNTGVELLYIENGDASSHTLTIIVTATVDGQVPPNKTVVMAAGKRFVIGPFPASTYNDANALVSFTYDAVTLVKLMPFKPA